MTNVLCLSSKWVNFSAHLDVHELLTNATRQSMQQISLIKSKKIGSGNHNCWQPYPMTCKPWPIATKMYTRLDIMVSSRHHIDDLVIETHARV